MTIPQPRFPHTLIRASAGTGKTFQLSNRYLGLAVAGIAPDEILATTFTRKAAGEILERVLSRLAQAADDPLKARELGAFLDDGELTCDRARQVLEGLVHHLHRLHVSTLDSFFAQLARSFDLELGLPPGWRIVEESADGRLRNEAIQTVLAEGEARDTVMLLHLLTKGEATRSISEQLRSLAAGLYGLFLETTEEAWDALPRPPRLTDDKLAAAVEALAACSLPSDKRFVKARDADLAAARAGDWTGLIGAGLASRVLRGETSYYGKPIDDCVAQIYQDLLRHAKAALVGQLADQTRSTRRFLEKFDAHYRRLKLNRRALRFDDVTRALAGSALGEHVHQLAFRLDTHLRHVLLDEFQDTSLGQWNVVRRLVVSVMQEGMGGRTQFNAPSPQPSPGGSGSHAPAPSLEASGSFFCVGDVKQAIYGWRGGVAELFDTLGSQWPALCQPTLTESRRSAQPIIDTVNRVFDSLDANPAVDKVRAAATAWRRGFETHTTAQRHLAGHARMITAPLADVPADQERITLDFAAGEIVRLVREAPGKSVGVLVRDNDAVANLIYELRRKEVAASEEGGNPLTDSPAVLVVLSLLTLADHPGDRAARFHVSKSPLGPAVSFTNFEDQRQADRLSLRIRQQLVTRGYGPTLYGWARDLAGHCDSRDASRLLQLVDLAYRYEPEAGLRTRDFMAFVEKQRVEAPSPADVRVMTIHQAKGLQFDIAVLPQLDVKLCGQPPAVVVGRPGPTAAANLVCRYANEALREMLPDDFRAAFERCAEQVIRESLCVLYVALTRPIHALHIIVAPSKPGERQLPSLMSGVLRAALTDGKPLAAETVVYEQGDPRWHQHRPRKTAPIQPRAVQPRPIEESWPRPSSFQVALAAPGKRRRRGLERESPSELARAAHLDLAARMLLESGRGVNRGSVFHAWFEQIEWLDDDELDDDGGLDDATLRRLGSQVGASTAEIDEWLAQFRSKLRNPRLRTVLSRQAYLAGESAPWATRAEICADLAEGQPAIEVFRERPFAVRLRDTLLSGTFDRLVLVRCHADDADSPSLRPGVSLSPSPRKTAVKERMTTTRSATTTLAAAEVLDYKTDAVTVGDPQAVAKIVARYRPQLSAYREAVSSMFGLPLERVMTRLMLIEADQVVEVE